MTELGYGVANVSLVPARPSAVAPPWATS
eukprot:SAG11_NODE_31410_length_292_cov_0.704663_1_plen_28_part_01